MYKTNEIKHVELSRLKVVRDVHTKDSLNAKKFAKKKEEMARKVDENKGRYPKDEAILVLKAKDSEDKRRVVYHIQDGFRRFLISQELGLEKVYVEITDEEIL